MAATFQFASGAPHGRRHHVASRDIADFHGYLQASADWRPLTVSPGRDLERYANWVRGRPAADFRRRAFAS